MGGTIGQIAAALTAGRTLRAATARIALAAVLATGFAASAGLFMSIEPGREAVHHD